MQEINTNIKGSGKNESGELQVQQEKDGRGSTTQSSMKTSALWNVFMLHWT